MALQNTPAAAYGRYLAATGEPPTPTREIHLTAYDADEREYEIVCTVEYGEAAGGRLMVVDARLAFDRDDAGVDERLAAALAQKLEQDRRDAELDRAESTYMAGVHDGRR